MILSGSGTTQSPRGDPMFVDSPAGEIYTLSYKDCQNFATNTPGVEWDTSTSTSYPPDFSSTIPFGCYKLDSTSNSNRNSKINFNWYPSTLYCSYKYGCLTSCTYTKAGCTDSTASNYDPDADYDDESCSDCNGVEIKNRGFMTLFDNTKPDGFYSISKSECEQHKIDNGGYSFTVYTTSPPSYDKRPTGCYRTYSSYRGSYIYYFNEYTVHNIYARTPASCGNPEYECLGACYTKAGCMDTLATNYDAEVDYPVPSECTYFFPNPDPVVATCSDTSSSSWCYSFTERDSIGDENTQYMTIQKREGFNGRDCAFDPTTDVLDFSTIDTQGLALYIGKNAFYNCKTFTSIVFPDNVDIIIGYDAFYSTNLNNLAVTNRMRIMQHGFRGSIINSLTFESGWNYPLRGFANLGGTITSFTVPPDVTEIDSYAFQNANNLETLILNEGLLTIGELAFTGTKITNVTIPSTVTNFQGSSFENSDSSVKIEFTFLSDSITIDNSKYIFPTSDLNDFSCGELKTEFNEESRNCDCV